MSEDGIVRDINRLLLVHESFVVSDQSFSFFSNVGNHNFLHLLFADSDTLTLALVFCYYTPSGVLVEL